MKILNTTQFISERMKIVPITNDELDKVKTYNYCPKTKDELKSIILKRVEKEGNECYLNDIDTFNITDMSGLFNGMVDFNGDISEWNVSNVTDMHGMFSYAESFNHDISKWNVSKVADMSGMFAHAESFNHDISKWKVSKVTDMNSMFAHAESFNHDISRWNVSDKADTGYMFYECPLNDNPPAWYKK